MFRSPSLLSLAVLSATLVACQGPGPAGPGDDRPDGVVDDDPNLGDLDRLHPDQEGPPSAVLDDLGFGLANASESSPDGEDEEAGVASSTLSGSFSGPAVSIDTGEVSSLGSATFDVDGVTWNLAALTVLGAVEDSDLAYAVLFDEDEPSTYVVIAAHAAALVPGATLNLDGQEAAALVIDEITREGQLSTSGTLTVTDSNLVDGGSLAASFEAELTPVELSAWPETLFPWDTGSEPPPDVTETTAEGAGEFAATLTDENAWQAGTANVSLDIAGVASFQAWEVYAIPYDGRDLYLVFPDANDPARQLIVTAPLDLVEDGAEIHIHPASYAAAFLAEADGGGVQFAEATLTLTEGGSSTGEALSGSLSITGAAWVFEGYDDPCLYDPSYCEDPCLYDPSYCEDPCLYDPSYCEDPCAYDPWYCEDPCAYDPSYCEDPCAWDPSACEDPCLYDPSLCQDPCLDDPSLCGWPDPQACTELASLPGAFEAALGAVLTAADLGGELPPGYDRVLFLQDANGTAGMAVLVAEGADLGAGVSLGWGNVQGQAMPLGYLYLFDCEQPLELEGGSLSIYDDGTGLWLVEGTYQSGGASYAASWTVQEASY